jgi:hypothetical protein
MNMHCHSNHTTTKVYLLRNVQFTALENLGTHHTIFYSYKVQISIGTHSTAVLKHPNQVHYYDILDLIKKFQDRIFI